MLSPLGGEKDMKKSALLALVAFAGSASAQFVATGPATVVSDGGGLGESFSAVYGGADTIFTSMQFTGTLTNPNATGTFASEADWDITTGIGGVIAGFQGGSSFTDPIPVDVTISSLVWANNGDNFNFMASESFDDSGQDAVWENPEFTFDGSAQFTDLGSFQQSLSQIDLIGSDFDTEIAIYSADGMLIDNNDDFSGLQSGVDSLALAEGNYIVVIGGFNSFFGDGLAFAGANGGNFVLNFDGVNIANGLTNGDDFAGFTFQVVPTPASAAILGLGGLVATRRRR